MSLCLYLSLCIGFVYFLSQTLTGFEILGSSNPPTCTCGLLDSGLKVGMVLPSSRILPLCIICPWGGWQVARGSLGRSHGRAFPGSRQSNMERGAIKGAINSLLTCLLLADFHPLCPQPGRAAGILGKKPYQLSSGLRWGLLSRSC